jgi:hypothetical protein
MINYAQDLINELFMDTIRDYANPPDWILMQEKFIELLLNIPFVVTEELKTFTNYLKN